MSTLAPSKPPLSVVKTNPAAMATTSLGQVRSLIEGTQFKQQLALALPKHCNPDRQLRVILTMLTKTPKLSECTQESLFTALLDCSQLGLEPDGRRAHLIPYGKTCQLIIDYKGLIELIMRSGFVDYIAAFPVYRNEKFKLIYGSHPSCIHEPLIDGDAGEFIGAYAVAHIKDVKLPKVEWMKKADIDAIRARSRSGNNGPWVTDYIEMAKKTVIRRISKTLPQSAELDDALDKDLEHDGVDGIPARRLMEAKPANVTAVTTSAPAANSEAPPQETVTTDQVVNDEPPFDTTEGTSTSDPELAKAEAEAAAEEEAARRKLALQEEEKRKAAAVKPSTPPGPPKPQTPPKTAPTNPPPAAGLPQSSPADVDNLRAKCVADGITEQKVCDYANAVYKTPKCSTLAELAAVSQRRVTLILHSWESMKAKIIAHKA